METTAKNDLFENAPVSSAVARLAIPTIISSLVMVIYNLADTYFIGLLNDPIQTAAVTLATPALLSFNAINNLFGVGTSSAMSRALGKGDRDVVKRYAAFGFYSAFMCAVLLTGFTGLFHTPLAHFLGADTDTFFATDISIKERTNTAVQ